MYSPKIVRGKVSGTGWPIDGHVLEFSQWKYDEYSSWHLHMWDDADDDAVMRTMYITEREAGFCAHDTLEAFAAAWMNEEWEPMGVFCLDLDKVEVLEILQEESSTPGKRRDE